MGVWGSQQVTLDPQCALRRACSACGTASGRGSRRCGDVLLHAQLGRRGAARRRAARVRRRPHGALVHRRHAERAHADGADDPGAGRPPACRTTSTSACMATRCRATPGSWLAFKALDDTIEVLGVGAGRPGARRPCASPTISRCRRAGSGLRLPDQPLRWSGASTTSGCPPCSPTCARTALNSCAYRQPACAAGHRRPPASRISTCGRRSSISASTSAKAARIGIRVFKVARHLAARAAEPAAFALGARGDPRRRRKAPGASKTRSEQLLYHWPRRAAAARARQARRADTAGAWLLPPNGELTRRAGRAGDRRTHCALPRGRAASTSARRGCAAKEDALEQSVAVAAAARLPRRLPVACRTSAPAARTTARPACPRAAAPSPASAATSWRPTSSPVRKIFSPMGSEGAAWVGHAPFTDTQHIFANMGDGTYYHSGLLVDSRGRRRQRPHHVQDPLQRRHRSHRRPGAAAGAQRARPSRASSRRKACSRSSSSPTSRRSTAAGRRFAKGVTVRHRDHLDAVQRELRDTAGVTALVYDQTCAAEKRRRRKRGAFPDPARRSFINTRVCEGCGDCSVKSNCVSVHAGGNRVRPQARDRPVVVQQGLLLPERLLPELRQRGGRAAAPGTGPRDRARTCSPRFPEPVLPALAKPYSIVVAGVGGTGIITVGRAARHGGAPRGQGRLGARHDRRRAKRRRGDHLRAHRCATPRTCTPSASPPARPTRSSAATSSSPPRTRS